jgi:uncharacterized glyoxalase superfamily protein PhnB
MRTASFFLAFVALFSAVAGPRFDEEEKHGMTVKKITPVLFVQDVEPCVKFWVERFGFKTTAEVPDGDKLAFAMLQKGSVELMYQSYASADKDVGTAISEAVRRGPTFLYVEVDDLEETIDAVKGAEIYMPKRQTFYGSTEIGIRDPAGHFVTFAEFASQPK